MIRKPDGSASASQPLMPGWERIAVPFARLPLTSAPPPNQSKNRNTNRESPAIPATISPVRSLDVSNSASLDDLALRRDSTMRGWGRQPDACSLNGVGQQHRDRHRADAARNRGDRPG